MPHIDDFLTPLKDGRWHKLEELRASVGVSEDKFGEALNFLQRFELVEVEGRRIRATPSAMPLLEERELKEPNSDSLLNIEEPDEEGEKEEEPVRVRKEEPDVKEAALIVKGKIGIVKMIKGNLSISGDELAAEWSPGVSDDNALTVLEALLDGEWHSYEEIAKELSIAVDQVIVGLETLASRGLIALSKSLARAKLRLNVASESLVNSKS